MPAGPHDASTEAAQPPARCAAATTRREAICTSACASLTSCFHDAASSPSGGQLAVATRARHCRDSLLMPGTLCGFSRRHEPRFRARYRECTPLELGLCHAPETGARHFFQFIFTKRLFIGVTECHFDDFGALEIFRIRLQMVYSPCGFPFSRNDGRRRKPAAEPPFSA